jgi:hypothetical protein
LVAVVLAVIGEDGRAGSDAVADATGAAVCVDRGGVEIVVAATVDALVAPDPGAAGRADGDIDVGGDAGVGLSVRVLSGAEAGRTGGTGPADASTGAVVARTGGAGARASAGGTVGRTRAAVAAVWPGGTEPFPADVAATDDRAGGGVEATGSGADEAGGV